MERGFIAGVGKDGERGIKDDKITHMHQGFRMVPSLIVNLTSDHSFHLDSPGQSMSWKET